MNFDKIWDVIALLIEGTHEEMAQNLSNQEFSELQKNMGKKNQIHVVSESDKNLGAVMADKVNAIAECTRQLYDINTYIKLSVEEMEILIAKIKSDFKDVVNRFKIANVCNKKGNYFLSKTNIFTIPHVSII